MFEIGAHLDCVNTARKVSRKEQQAQQSERFKVLVGSKQPLKKRIIQKGAGESTGAWLRVIPNGKNNTGLSPYEFRDGLAVRYGKALLNLPASCDGCGARFSAEHGMNWPTV